MMFELSLIHSWQVMLSSPVMTELVVFFARYAIFIHIVIAVIAFRSASPKWKHAVREAGWAFIFALLITTIISQLVGRLRPFQVDVSMLRLIPPPWNFSFPSGHTAVSVALAGIWLRADRRVGVALLILALLIGASRVLAGVHYPSDILGGMVVGVVTIWLVRYGHRRLRIR